MRQTSKAAVITFLLIFSFLTIGEHQTAIGKEGQIEIIQKKQSQLFPCAEIALSAVDPADPADNSYLYMVFSQPRPKDQRYVSLRQYRVGA